MTFSPEFLLQLVAAVGAAVGVYVGIRADLAVTHAKAQDAKESASEAHNRIDAILMKENAK